ncbi:MAG TPA: hypothetical protein PLB41_02295 [Rubrivivax sp.]|nr:hypothetical protein [Rubrivivax sp.]HPO18390.1 hypothetical protein [Rubrivivax sp.]
MQLRGQGDAGTAARVMAVAVPLAACAAVVWIMHRLMSPSVRQEFA